MLQGCVQVGHEVSQHPGEHMGGDSIRAVIGDMLCRLVSRLWTPRVQQWAAARKMRKVRAAPTTSQQTETPNQGLVC